MNVIDNPTLLQRMCNVLKGTLGMCIQYTQSHTHICTVCREQFECTRAYVCMRVCKHLIFEVNCEYFTVSQYVILMDVCMCVRKHLIFDVNCEHFTISQYVKFRYSMCVCVQ